MAAPMERASPSHPAGLLPPRRHHALVVLLAVTSGALDALGFLALGGVFASVMTGNLVLLGLGAGTRHGGLAIHALAAIAGFVLGVSVGARATRADEPPAVPVWTRRLRALVAVELALVTVFAVGWELVRDRHSTPAQLALIVLASTAMGLQSAAMRVSTGNGRSTTYLTGTLTGAVMALAGGGRFRAQWPDLAVLAAACAGAVLAGAVLTAWSSVAPAVPLVALVCVLLVGRPTRIDVGGDGGPGGAAGGGPDGAPDGGPTAA